MGHDANPSRIFIDQNVVGSLMWTFGEYVARYSLGVVSEPEIWSGCACRKRKKPGYDRILEPGGERRIQ